MRRLCAWLFATAAMPALAQTAPGCVPDPLAGRGLYLRGSFNGWAADEAQRFAWACTRWEAVLRLDGEHTFKVGDDAWSADADFGQGPGGDTLAPRGGNLSRRFDGRDGLEQRAVLTPGADGAPPRLTFEPCAAPALGSTRLFLRGSMSNWAALDDYAFRWRCDAYVLNVDLAGRQEFKVADADWSPATSFGAGPGGRLVAGGENLAYAFGGGHTVVLRVDGGTPVLQVGPKTLPDLGERRITDPVALSLRFDSRAAAHKRPFGAVTAGRTLHFTVAAAPGVEQLTLVVERRLLEGNQDRLVYTELARVPMKRSAAADGERWQASHRFADIAVHGYWFEARIGGQAYVLQNNADTVPWTRERGSGGAGSVAPMPAEAKAIRRFRQTVYDPAFKVPDWAADVVYYQIFPDRFRNGDPRNDPKPGRDKYQDHDVEFHANWLDRPWRPGTGDGSDRAHNNDFFGGDLEGIIQKLPLLRELGVNTLYLTPVFKAPSNHKYDTADYKAIDPGFGTEADFRRLTQQARRLGIRVIPDTSFNHTGSDSRYFDRYGHYPTLGAFEGGRVQPASPWASWYRFDTTQADPAKQYKGWGGPDLPEIDKSSPDFRRYAYGARDSVTLKWLDAGAAGWRMDVAPWVPDDFWREWRRAVKRHQPDALTVAETWFDASKYFLGDMFDSTMNYIFRNAVLDYAGGGRAQHLVANLELMREAYPPQAFHALMNLISGHDSARALHVLGAHDGSPPEAVALAKQRLRLAVFIQMTQPGAPHVYYGDEVGVGGGDDPYNRATYPWPDLGGRPDEDLRADFKRLIALRHAHPVLRRGTLQAPLFVDDQVVVQLRRLGRSWALTATHNGDAPRRVTVTLPAGTPAAWQDALGSERLRAPGGRLTLDLPPRFGRVLVNR